MAHKSIGLFGPRKFYLSKMIHFLQIFAAEEWIKTRLRKMSATVFCGVKLLDIHIFLSLNLHLSWQEKVESYLQRPENSFTKKKNPSNKHYILHITKNVYNYVTLVFLASM